MESAKSSYERITNAVDNLNYLMTVSAADKASEEEKKKIEGLKDFTEKFDKAMDDDVNTADALSSVFDLVRYANSEVSAENSKEFIGAVKKELLDLCDILGLKVEKKQEVLDSDIEELIAQRQAARKAKDFAKADAIRGQLSAMGITLLDTREGVKWKRT